MRARLLYQELNWVSFFIVERSMRGKVEDKDMQEMKRNCDGGGSNGDVKKERHIVTWSQQVPFLASLSALTHLASRNVIISLPSLEFFYWL